MLTPGKASPTQLLRGFVQIDATITLLFNPKVAITSTLAMISIDFLPQLYHKLTLLPILDSAFVEGGPLRLTILMFSLFK